MKYKLLEILKNSGGWVKSPEIESLMGHSPAEIRSLVNELRRSGEPVVSGTGGYKYATTEDEITLCLANLYSRAASIRDAAIGLEKSRGKVNGTPDIQGSLFDFIPKRQYG